MRGRPPRGSGSRAASRDGFTTPRGSNAPVRVPQTKQHKPRCWIQPHGPARCMHVHRAASMDRVGACFTSMTGAQDTQRRSPPRAPAPKTCHGWPLSCTSVVLPCTGLRFLNVGKPVAMIICTSTQPCCARLLRFGPVRYGAPFFGRREGTTQQSIR